MSHGIRRLAVPVAAVALAGCTGMQGMFPRHEDVYIPLESSTGEMRVVGTDTSYVLRGEGFRVVAADRRLFESVQEPLDDVSATWRRYFGTAPREVRIRLVGVEGSRRPDSTLLRPDSAGTVVLPIRILGDRQRAMTRRLGRRGGITRPVVRAWLAALGDSVGAGPTAGVTTGAGPRRGLPDWAVQALPALITGEPAPELMVVRAAQAADRLIPLRTVVTGARPVPDSENRGREDITRDPLLDPSLDHPGAGRRRGAVGGDEPLLTGSSLFDAEAVAIAEYIAQREGRPFLGQASALMATGATFEEVLLQARSLPRDIDGFDRDWREWLAKKAAEAGERAGR